MKITRFEPSLFENGSKSSFTIVFYLDENDKERKYGSVDTELLNSIFKYVVDKESTK